MFYPSKHTLCLSLSFSHIMNSSQNFCRSLVFAFFSFRIPLQSHRAVSRDVWLTWIHNSGIKQHIWQYTHWRLAIYIYFYTTHNINYMSQWKFGFEFTIHPAFLLFTACNIHSPAIQCRTFSPVCTRGNFSSENLSLSLSHDCSA